MRGILCLSALALGLFPKCSCEDGGGVKRGAVEMHLSFLERDPCSGVTVPRRLPDDFVALDRPLVTSFGAQSERVFEVRALGTLPLEVRSVALSETHAEFALEALDEKGQPATFPLRLAPNPDVNHAPGLLLKVRYTQADAESDRVDLVIQSDDPKRGEVRFGLSAGLGRIQVCTESGCDRDAAVAFGNVPIGQSAQKEITIKNIGESDLEIQNLALESSSAEFCAEKASSNPNGASCTPIDFCRVLQPGEELDVEVRYGPQDAGQDTGVLRLEAGGLITSVPISGAGSGAALCVRASSIDFGNVRIGQSAEERVRLESCGTDPVELVSAVLETAAGPFQTGPEFSIVTAFRIGTLAPGEYSEGLLRYQPTSSGRHTGGLKITHGSASPLWIGLLGRAASCDLEAVPLRVSFGTVGSGSSSERFVQLANNGPEDCVLSAITDPANGFSIVNKPSLPLTIPSAQSIDLGVRYTAPSRSSSSLDTSSFEVVSNEPAPDDRITVELSAMGGGVAACRFEISPSARSTIWNTAGRFTTVDFGNVGVYQIRRLPLVFQNVGSQNCTISRIDWDSAPNTPEHGFGLELENGTVVDVGAQNQTPYVVAPGQTQRFVATFSPTSPPSGLIGSFGYLPEKSTCTAFGRTTAFCNGLKFTTDDSLTDTSGMVAMGTFDGIFSIGFRGKPVLPNAVIVPEQLDFGLVQIGCGSRTLRATLYNQGVSAISVAEPAINPNIAAPNEEFKIVSATGGGPWPRSVPAGQSMTFEVRFFAKRNGLHAAQLELSTLDGSGAVDLTLSVALSGEGTTESSRTDIFHQRGSSPKVDIVWVMDDSGSMGDEADRIAQNTQQFFSVAGIEDADYHIGVTTTLTTTMPCTENGIQTCNEDAMSGHYSACSGNDRFITQQSTNLESQFQCNIQVDPPRPTRSPSDGAEGALQAAMNFVSPPKSTDPAANAGFLRADAALQLVLVSDEEDQSLGPVDLYVDFFKNIKGFRNQNLVNVSVIGVPAAGSSCSSVANPRYEYFAQEMNGIFVDICTQDWTQALIDIGRQAIGLLSSFILSSTPEPSSLEVCVRAGGLGTPCDAVPATNAQALEGYYFDPADDAVVFNRDSIPPVSSVIEVTYEAVCF